MFPPGLRATTFTRQRMRTRRSNLPCMTRSISSLLAPFLVAASAAAQPVAFPCPPDITGVCVSGGPSVNVKPASVDKPGFRVAIERRSLRAHPDQTPLPDNDNASPELHKAEPVQPRDPAWKTKSRVAPGRVHAGATVPARFTERPPGADLQSKSIADAQLSDETRRRSAGWLEYFPEWHAGWALIIGLLVVALRRVPLRFRSNGL